ncbi:MAG: FumA C-terminus/TtdB family hydratase beta subunit [Firmicutes bacterium]|nr:FumA C-terminus/TtdB family hydratase beta subunit [Bacillota bacterium]
MKLHTPIDKNKLKNLNAGEEIYISGTIYTARDSAHKLLLQMINNNEKLPFELNGAVIYYAGPSPTKPGEIVGSIGPTTSYRMDKYTPDILKEGAAILIGKGSRNEEVKISLLENGAIYCAALGGAGALMASKVKSSSLVAFSELGPEAIYKLEVEDFPVIVVNDLKGNDIYECH